MPFLILTKAPFFIFAGALCRPRGWHRFAPVAALALALLMAVVPAQARDDLPEIDWVELMPAEDLKLLESMPEIEHEGAGPVTLPDEIMTGRVVPEMDGRAGKIPGFVVPLKTTEDMKILEFFLVPYYGACIHVPPPPPNQIIHVKYKKGFKLEALYEPVWVEGVLNTEQTRNDIASASYAIVADRVRLYEE